jgi:6-pyruvoyltetrahydropterin/6-carboxytetrahydropterin synthase
MHGHGFEVILHANQDIAGLDMGLDFDRLAALWAPLQAELHHACLNDIPGLENPTSEMLAGWLWQRLQPVLPALSWITVYETATAGCHYDGRHYRIWKELRFESALKLRAAPDGDPRRRLHGHSYLLRLHLTAPLDQDLGWTVDYGDVKVLFKPVYERLDHHRLNDLSGLRDADPGSLVRWMREAVADRLPQLDRIDLHETPGCGASLCWGDLGPALPT